MTFFGYTCYKKSGIDLLTDLIIEPTNREKKGINRKNELLVEKMDRSDFQRTIWDMDYFLRDIGIVKPKTIYIICDEK